MNNVIRIVLIGVGGSLLTYCVHGIGRIIYAKGQRDAYKEISNDLNGILIRNKKSENEESK